MKRITPLLIASPLLLLIGGAGALWLDHHFDLLARAGLAAHKADDEEAGGLGEHVDGAEVSASEGEIEPVPSVRTAVAQIGEITQSREVFGSVVPRPGSLVTRSLNCEVVVTRVGVVAGQMVDKDDPLCDVQPSPSTLAELAVARDDVESSGKLLQAARERQSANLGTRQELIQAEAAERQARIKLAQLQATLPEESGIVRANSAGRVMDVHVQSGAVVAPGTALAEILEGDARVIEIAVLPEDAAHLTPGERMPLEVPGRATSDTPLIGTIEWLGGSVDPASHMVDVYLAPPSQGQLRAGEIVRGRIERMSSGHVIVPREAVLPTEDGQVIFVVEDGHAHRRVVTIGLQTQKQVEIIGGHIKPGDQVVTLGNYELEDGMAVMVWGAESRQ